MDLLILLFIVGSILLFCGIIGGQLKIGSTLEIPAISGPTRILSALAGLLLIISAAYLELSPRSHEPEKTYLLGVGVEAISNETIEICALEDETGVRVVDILNNSLAQKIGILHEDVIISINDKTIYGPSGFLDVVKKANDDKLLSIGLLRNCHYIVLSARL